MGANFIHNSQCGPFTETNAVISRPTKFGKIIQT